MVADREPAQAMITLQGKSRQMHEAEKTRNDLLLGLGEDSLVPGLKNLILRS